MVVRVDAAEHDVVQHADPVRDRQQPRHGPDGVAEVFEGEQEAAEEQPRQQRQHGELHGLGLGARRSAMISNPSPSDASRTSARATAPAATSPSYGHAEAEHGRGHQDPAEAEPDEQVGDRLAGEDLERRQRAGA